jgi:CheY-like chemotaxis protein
MLTMVRARQGHMAEACNVILVEDEPFDRKAVAQGLARHGHVVTAFKDVATLNRADRDGSLGFEIKGHTVIMLNVVLAYDLGDSEGPAIRWQGEGPLSCEEARRYADDYLGMQVARDIRDGRYQNIPRTIPILIFTARANETIFEEIERLSSIGRTGYLGKPAFSEDMHKAVEKLIV